MPYADFRDHLLAGLGGEWPDSGPLNAIRTNRVQKDGYRIEELSYEAEPDDRIPALLLVILAFGQNIDPNSYYDQKIV